jgi:hypothetical protein
VFCAVCSVNAPASAVKYARVAIAPAAKSPSIMKIAEFAPTPDNVSDGVVPRSPVALFDVPTPPEDVIGHASTP